MSPAKIIRIAALAIAVIAAFVTIPYSALLLVLLGLGIGFLGVPDERRLIFLVGTGVLAMTTGALDAVPAIGPHLTAILKNLSSAFNAGAIAVLAMMFKDRVTE